MGLRNTQTQRVSTQGHESVEEVTLEEIKEAIENRPLPTWIVAFKMIPIQPGEFTVADFAREAKISKTTARAWLAKWIEEGKLTRIERKRPDGRRVWAYREVPPCE